MNENGDWKLMTTWVSSERKFVHQVSIIDRAFVWSDGPVLPFRLVDIVADTTAAATDNADEEMLSFDESSEEDNCDVDY